MSGGRTDDPDAVMADLFGSAASSGGRSATASRTSGGGAPSEVRRATTPPSPGPARRRRRRRAARVTVVAVVVALIVAAVVGFFVYQAARQAAEEHGAAAAATVQRYLEAVAAGDAAAALTNVQGAAAPGGMLTNEVLSASMTAAPITGITTTAEPIWGSSGQVAVTYLLGTAPVSERYEVVDAGGDGSYLLTGTSQITFGSAFRGLSLTLNGVAVTGDPVPVFPGTYTLGVTTPNYTIADSPAFPVTAPQATSVPAQITPSLTDAGVQAYRAAVSGAVSSCLASRALAAGCGLDLPATLSDGTTLYDGSIFRVLSPEAQAGLASVVPQLDPTDPALAVSGTIGPVTTAGNCTQGGADGECDIRDAPVLEGAVVDMLQSPLTVQWR